MAIWQFRIDLIPEEAIRKKFGDVPIAVPQELAENFWWWSDIQPAAGFEAWLEGILPEARSWSPTMRIWGDERGDTGSVCYDGKNKVEWIGFRVDVRELSPNFVKSICEFARRLECLLLTGTYHLLAPEDSTVFSAIMNSTAQRYFDDPVSTLRSFKNSSGDVISLPKKEK